MMLSNDGGLANSPLRLAIAAAIDAKGKRAAGIRLSITGKAEWYHPPDAPEKVWVKWICWRLVSKNGHNITKPMYGILHGGLSQRTLMGSLREWFPKQKCTVDHDILLS